MRSFSKKLFLTAIGIAVLGAAYWIWDPSDQNWPKSGEERIAKMARILIKTEGRARWCYPSSHPENLQQSKSEIFRACAIKIAPTGTPTLVSDDTLQQFWTGRTGEYFCEINLSTVKGDDRVVGSDCYTGLFHKKDYIQTGLTDDPYG